MSGDSYRKWFRSLCCLLPAVCVKSYLASAAMLFAFWILHTTNSIAYQEVCPARWCRTVVSESAPVPFVLQALCLLIFLRATDSWSKGCKFSPGGRNFFSRVNFVSWLWFGVRSTPLLSQWHVKYPGHSAKSAGGRLHINTHTPLTQRSWSALTMPLSRHSVGTYPEKAHTQLVREHSATVISARRSTVDWSWPKEWN